MPINAALRHRLAIGCVALMVLGAAASQPDAVLAAGPAWAVQPGPQPTGRQGLLSDVWCGSATACVAVGSYTNNAGRQVTLAEGWNGTSWIIRATPNPTGATGSVLIGLACTSSTACIAVGSSGKGSTATTLAETWNGTAWNIKPTPNPAGAQTSSLRHVSCTSATACTAVGRSSTASGTATTLAERWNGTTWTIQPTPNPTGVSAVLLGVSCSSVTACTAVGLTYGTTTIQTLAEAWNGSTWTIQPTPNPSGATDSELPDVACTSPTACIAVGFANPGGSTRQTLAEKWDGTSWTIQATPNPSGASGSYILAVSCFLPAACTAVGFSIQSGAVVPLAESLSGGTWTIQPTPAPSGATQSTLLGISCSSSSQCTAVGAQYPMSLAETWNGSTWSIQPTANQTGDVNNVLTAVSCASATSCEALGSRTGALFGEGWNGTTWTLQTVPSPSGATASSLLAVSCGSPVACIAVGFAARTGPTVTAFAEAWNGTAWTVQVTPSPSGTLKSILQGVSCTASTACMAVGFWGGTGGSGALIESWNGTSWTIQPAPGGPTASLAGVSCTSSAACTAVGASQSGTLAEVWNGTSWSVQPTPNPSGGTSNRLLRVSCTSTTNCAAVGIMNTTTGASPFSETWNGTVWTLVPMPVPSGATSATITDVSCAASAACEAVGTTRTSTGFPTAFADSWNGASWAIQATPSPAGAAGTQLMGVSCIAATACIAVGGFANPFGPTLALIERYS